jgi:hypothetical protein
MSNIIIKLMRGHCQKPLVDHKAMPHEKFLYYAHSRNFDDE